jgi:hypothetical protein
MDDRTWPQLQTSSHRSLLRRRITRSESSMEQDVARDRELRAIWPVQMLDRAQVMFRESRVEVGLGHVARTDHVAGFGGPI